MPALLDALIEALDVIGDSNTRLLEQIRDEPTIQTPRDPTTLTFSSKAFESATRVLARIKGVAPIRYALENPAAREDRAINLKLLVALGGTADERRTVRDLLLERLRSGNEDEETAACIGALGDLRDRSAAQPLAQLATTDAREPVRLAAVLALMKIEGAEACAWVEEFLTHASSNSRIVVASAAWRMDLDPIYDLLLSLEADPRMSANVLYSVVRAKSPRAKEMVLASLSSASTYLRKVAAASASHLLGWLPNQDSYLSELVPMLRSGLQAEDEMFQTLAVVDLVRAGQSDMGEKAREILVRYLLERDFSFAQCVLVNGALGLPEWPDDRAVRALLYHTQARIRGTACFLVASQRRRSFEIEIRNLQRDPSRVPQFGDGSIDGLAGTVAENAARALRCTTSR